MIYVVSYIWTGLQVLVFVIGTTIALTVGIEQSFWLSFWKVYVLILIVLSAIVIVWFTIGGIRDMKRMTSALATMERDPDDDGRVRD